MLFPDEAAIAVMKAATKLASVIKADSEAPEEEEKSEL
jgi:hypothetical protein